MSLADKGKLKRYANAASVCKWAAIVVLWATVSSAFGFSISSVEATRDADNNVLVEMNFDVELTQDVIHALESSIPITVLTNIKIYRVRTTIWDQFVDEYDFRDKIVYRSLYGAYRLNTSDPDINGDYPSLESILEALGEKRTHQLALNDEQSESDEDYRGKVKITLDRSALPSVMRLPVFFKKSWRLQSNRVAFDIQ